MSRSKKNLSQVSIDTEAFIYEVHRRPTLWDPTTREYSDTSKKKQAWGELVQEFYDKDAALKYSEADFCTQLQKKWKNLRDCYSRELKNRRRAGLHSGSRKTSEYMYFDNLSFLENVIIPKRILEQEVIINSTAQNSPPRRKQRKATKTSTNDGKSLMETSGSRTTSYGETSRTFQKEQNQVVQEKELEVGEDCDRMFLLSLLDPLKQIPEYARFGVKRKLMELLDNELQLHLETINPQITITDTENFEIA